VGLLALVGCGRLSFDPLADDVQPDPLSRCAAIDFDDGTTGGLEVVPANWQVVDAAGPDGSPALVAIDLGVVYTYAPSVGPVSALDLELDVRLADVMTSDLILLMVGRTLGDRSFQAQIGVIAGDTPEDVLSQGNPSSQLDSAVPVLTGGWHHIQLRYTGEVLDVFVDDTLHLSAANLTAVPHFETLIGFGSRGAIDNVVLRCTTAAP